MTTDPPAVEGDRPSSPLPFTLRPLGALEPLYRWAVSRRNAGFDRGERVWHAPVPVLSVGNITLGGTGKTPVVTRLAHELLARHSRPIIAMRGYKKRGQEMSDEEAEYRDSLEGVTVLADPDRASAIAGFFDAGGKADCVLLDDAFQHRFVARDLDIVLIDAMRDPFADRCLPGGWLREPVGSLARADALIVTRADRVDARTLNRLLERLREVADPGALLVTCVHRWSHLERHTNADEPANREQLEALAPSRVLLVAGIGNPAAFRAQVESSGASIVGEQIFADHAEYTTATVARILAEATRRGATSVVTTAKDWVKIRRVLRSPANESVDWIVPRVEIEFRDGEREFLDRAFEAAGA
jgi:tetraacyldisaccharide 4'-kinase